MTLDPADLPGFFRAADEASLRGQRETLTYLLIRLVGLVVAAAGGSVGVVVGELHLAAVLAATGLGAALVGELALALREPERDWHDGRALAESVKTLAWRFAVRADPFPSAMSDDEARRLLIHRLSDVRAQASRRVPTGTEAPVISSGMLRLRHADFATRRNAYVASRTEDQQAWYAAKAAHNDRWDRIWTLVRVVAEVLAIVLAASGIWGDGRPDLAGVLAAVVASLIAWTAAKQHRPLTAAYRLAAGELALQTGLLGACSEAAWAQAAADAEEAISREHTMWVASRSGPFPL